MKFGWKIPNCFGKTATSPQGEGIFLTHTVHVTAAAAAAAATSDHFLIKYYKKAMARQQFTFLMLNTSDLTKSDKDKH